jgi:PE-PPE domain-containing protein
MAKHCKPSRGRRVRWRATTGATTAFVGLSGLAALTAADPNPSHADRIMLVDTVTNIDGTNYPDGSTRMGNELQGQYNQPGDNVSYVNDTNEYPGTLGVYSGATAPSGDQSIADGAAALDERIKQNDTNSGGQPQTVVCYSLGCAATTREQQNLVDQGYDTHAITFVEIADPNRPNGGLLARMPDGTYIPFLGITGGNATPTGDAKVTYVTQEGDGIADAPEYPIFVTSDANALLGAVYLHNDYTNVNANDPNNEVTTSPDGRTTDILVPSKPGEEPLLLPLNGVVPQPILAASSPLVDSTIDPGYDRTADPSVQQRFALAPPPAALIGDGQGLVTGATQTAQQLPGAVVTSVQQTVASPSLPSPKLPPQLSSATTGGNLFKPNTVAGAGPTGVPSIGKPVAGALSGVSNGLGSLKGVVPKP